MTNTSVTFTAVILTKSESPAGKKSFLYTRFYHDTEHRINCRHGLTQIPFYLTFGEAYTLKIVTRYSSVPG
jgi:hypothetical protein